MRLTVLTVKELREYASDTGIVLPVRLKKKEDIIPYIEKTLSDPEFAENLKRKKQQLEIMGRKR
jgi:hypothetical protein|tara:strand:+ start:844 stop:1035 length:192 start_codon:yes stop_codon:yes gene_type:complete